MNNLNKIYKNNIRNLGGNNGSGSGSTGMMGSTLIIFLIIAVLIVVYLYITYRGYNNFVTNSPMIIRDTIDGSTPMRVDAYKLPSPSDGKYGMEYTYSFWIYLKDTNFNGATEGGKGCTAEEGHSYDSLNFKHIFHKGSNDMYVGAGSSKLRNLPLLQSPGVWLYPDTNKLNIRFNTYNDVYETCDVGNIPINKWVHISIILIGNSVDVYVNCNLKKRQKLSGLPKLNEGDLLINNFGGFGGFLSRFRYYNYAIDPFELDLICKMGPSESVPTTDLGASAGNGLSYLSPNYWFNYGFPMMTNEKLPAGETSGSTAATAAK
jgi:Concanavalin A-like lectin/glucanases superfamily